MPRSPSCSRSYPLRVIDSPSSRFRRDGFVAIVSAEEQKAVYLPVELVGSEQQLLGQPSAIGWLSGMDEITELRRELDSVWEEADEQHRAVVKEAAELVDYSLEAGRAFIAVFRGADAVA